MVRPRPIALVMLCCCGPEAASTDPPTYLAECVVLRTTPIPLDETSALGFPPSAVGPLLRERHGLMLKYRNETETTLSITLAGPRAAYLVEHESTGDPEWDEWCHPRLVVDVAMTFKTQDGNFDEVIEAKMDVESPARATWEAAVAQLKGALEIRDCWLPRSVTA